jgi:general secretion pathway protein G
MRRHHRSARGVSLIEIVVYITIASMLLAAVAVYAVGVQRDSQRTTAFMDVKNAANALDLYRAATGRYPDPEQGFAPLVRHRTLKSTPKDPWGNPLVWRLDAHAEPVVLSLGADGKEGGVDDAADVASNEEAP